MTRRSNCFGRNCKKFSDKTREAALGFVEGLYAGGSTNIDGALTKALEMLKDDDMPTYVLFLTDGQPTAGETDEMKIVKNAGKHNDVTARILSMGVGYDVNSRLLDRLSRANHGASEYVRPNEDIEAKVSKIYDRIAAPVLTGVELKITRDEGKDSDGPAVNRVSPRDVRDLFAGDTTVIVGRYKKPGELTVNLTGRTGQEKHEYEFEGKLDKRSNSEKYGYIAKLWASRRIGEIIDEIDLKGKNDELVEELVKLSKEHGILTPYTSFLADDQPAPTRRNSMAFDAGRPIPQERGVAPGVRSLAGRAAGERDNLGGFGGSFGADSDEMSEAASPATPALLALPSADDSHDMAAERLSGLKDSAGASGFEQRAKKADMLGSYRYVAPSSAPMSGSGGYGGGYGAGSSGPGAYGSASGYGVAGKPAEGAEVATGSTTRAIGTKTFFSRGGVWVDGIATAKQIEDAKKIERFSDDYFQLITKYGDVAAKYLAQDGEILVVLDGQAYRF